MFSHLNSLKFISKVIIAIFAIQTNADDVECPKFCPMNYDPICAVTNDGVRETFGNLCAMKSANCLLKKGYTVATHSECN